MSSDNGVYILVTKGPEYRVAHAQNIDDIYGMFSDDTFRWEGNDEMLYHFFHDSPVFSDQQKALDFAIELSYSYDYLEYGICEISDFKDKDFNNLRNNYGKE